MKTKTRTTITYEAWQRTVVTRSSEPVHIVCGLCEAETAMFTANEFARLIGLTPRQMYRQIEAGAFHFIENADGSLLICENSSQNQLTGEKL